MKRTPLIIVAFVFALACAAQFARAEARGPRVAPGDPAVAKAARLPPVPSPTSPRKFDEYGKLRWADEKARLDNVAAQLRDEPALRVYLICYDGRRARAGEARRRCSRAAGYLSKTRGVEPARVFTLVGGYREDVTVELWPFPQGVRPPQPSPTVDPSEVKFLRDARGRKHATRADRRPL